ncbi:Phosphoribosylformimino-5-aminoimidazole carboxamide ribotide isomerase [Candidatus Johnevansia muelleri]|uniref:1-(5-phosphoribosyl)-5-[(5-phosphoribosylamino)methylideneamino] imidazole-4-carboxamide isomerase n=1 Tax=Candidatus Johnevansia muelleri TaxID=1495769 RepID=A0A078KHL0_9GAMM|nr:Phosphoribosylformimino-5-aminoimidazole carboxamide ribotide isomerase [Candidatus Evansia muelleri]
MLIIPAIDIKDGRCVRLKQGRMDEFTNYDNNPIFIAEKFIKAGARRLHLIDLNGAIKGKPINENVIKQITKNYPDIPIQIGGGIRNRETIQYYLDAGVSHVILGTIAVLNTNFVIKILEEFGNNIIISMDTRNEFLSINGWTENSNIIAIDLIRIFYNYGLYEIIYTDINRDGMMQGLNIKSILKFAQEGGLPVIASGGVRDMTDIFELLNATKISSINGVIIGRAIYEGNINLTEAQKLVDNFKK